MDWAWYFITSIDKTWFPPKDLDSRDTKAYTAPQLTKYNLFYYYAALILVGSEILPTDNGELLFGILLIFVSTILIGMVIGEFASLLASITKKERLKSEELDVIATIMVSLRLPEDLQDRVLQYYDQMNEANYIKNEQIYDTISPSLKDAVKLFQNNKSIKEISFLNIANISQIESFWSSLEMMFYLPGDIVIKQGEENQYLYVVNSGIVEVILEHRDFAYFNSKSVESFIAHSFYEEQSNTKTRKFKGIKEHSPIDIDEESSKNEVVHDKLANVFFEALAKSRQNKHEIEVNFHQTPDSDSKVKFLHNSREESVDSLLLTSKNQADKNSYQQNSNKSISVEKRSCRKILEKEEPMKIMDNTINAASI